MQENMKVTSIKDLKKYSEGTIVKLPDFAEGQEFIAKLRRPSMLKLVKEGDIPNSLLKPATSMFEGGVSNVLMDGEDGAMDKIFDVMDALCKASFVEPTWQQLIEEGIELTDEQKMFVFDYSQNGVQALENFRR